MSSITQDLIGIAYKRLLEQIPSLQKLKLVARLELRGRGDVQVFRISAPGPEITKEEPEDARILESQLNPHSADFQANAAAMRDVVEDLRQHVERVAQGGGAAARAKHEARGKLKRVR